MTTELSGLVTYVIGGLVSRQQYWVATTVAVLSLALLELKTALENFSKRVPGEEIVTFTKFLVLSAVILPIVPNRTYGTFGFNPFKTWLVVVAVSAISYGSYLLQVWSRGRGGVLLAALLGGAYSSTLTTVVLAKRAREQSRPHLYSGAMLVASGVMYLRLLALLGIFNRQLFQPARIAVPAARRCRSSGWMAMDAQTGPRRCKSRAALAAEKSLGVRRRHSRSRDCL